MYYFSFVFYLTKKKPTPLFQLLPGYFMLMFYFTYKEILFFYSSQEKQEQRNYSFQEKKEAVASHFYLIVQWLEYLSWMDSFLPLAKGI